MIEMRSDTFTLPNLEMMEAINKAPLGDDVYGLDSTVNQLEEKAAKLLGKEAAILFPSGTMANLSAIMVHCPRGSKVIAGDSSDVYIYEAGGASVCGGVIYEPVPTEENGTLKIDNIEKVFPKDLIDPQFALPSLICIENPNNRGGGRVLPLAYLEELNIYAKTKEVPIHMDGARIFNAAVALEISPEEIAKYADSVQFCLSKGLGCPIGSIVAGNNEFIKKVRRVRKMLGGGMRQAGVIAAPGLHALDNWKEVLVEDHCKALKMAEELNKINGINIKPNVEINMVFFTISKEYDLSDFLSICRMKGLNLSELKPEVIRAVLYKDISYEDITTSIEIIKNSLLLSIISNGSTKNKVGRII